MSAAGVPRVRVLYRLLLEHYASQQWWPADDPFEMMVGAVLVQNTAWRNVERAIDNLRAGGLLDWRCLAAAREPRVAHAIRPSGTFRVKARRVLALARFVREGGGPEGLRRRATPALRAALLSVHGVGEETADAILCYAFARRRFVVDAYTRRICARVGVTREPGAVTDAALRDLFHQALPASAAAHGECHALLVAHAKAHCRVRPVCAACPLRGGCDHARR